jgi:hypothetical protein
VLRAGLAVETRFGQRSARESYTKPGMVVHICNPGISKAEAGGWRVQDSLGYIVRCCLKNKSKAYIVVK